MSENALQGSWTLTFLDSIQRPETKRITKTNHKTTATSHLTFLMHKLCHPLGHVGGVLLLRLELQRKIVLRLEQPHVLLLQFFLQLQHLSTGEQTGHSFNALYVGVGRKSV